MARFKKGQSGNPTGRPKRSKNRIVANTKDWIQSLIDTNRGQIERDLKAMEPGERVRVITGLLSYVTPKMQSVSIEDQLNAEYQSLEKLLESAPDEALDQIIEKIKRLKKDEQAN